MKYKRKAPRLVFTLILLLSCFSLFSQTHTSGTEGMADFFNAHGKLFVVVTVLLIIFLGVYLFLFTVDKKVAAIRKRTSTK